MIRRVGWLIDEFGVRPRNRSQLRCCATRSSSISISRSAGLVKALQPFIAASGTYQGRTAAHFFVRSLLTEMTELKDPLVHRSRLTTGKFHQDPLGSDGEMRLSSARSIAAIEVIVVDNWKLIIG